MVKFKYIKYALLAVLLIVISFIVIFFNNSNKKTIIETNPIGTNSDEEYLFNVDSSPYDVLITVLNDDKAKIEKLPLTKDLIEKYKTEKLNSDDRFVNFYYNQTNDETWYNIRDLKENEYEIFADGKQDDKYVLIYHMDVDGYFVKSIKLIETIQLADTNGEPTEESKYIFDETNYEWLLRVAMYPQEYDEATKRVYGIPSEITRRNIGLTDNFIKKYGYENDIIQYDANISFRPETGSSYDDRIITFSIIKDYQNKEIKYKYRFYLDNKNYLDDVELIEQDDIVNKPVEKLKYSGSIIDYVVVKNSDWSVCPFSEKFLSKYNSNDGLFPNYDFSYLKIENVNNDVVNKKLDKLFVRLYDKNNKYKKCLFNFIWNDKKEVDDILIYMIPEDKLELSNEEQYKLAFN